MPPDLFWELFDIRPRTCLLVKFHNFLLLISVQGLVMVNTWNNTVSNLSDYPSYVLLPDGRFIRAPFCIAPTTESKPWYICVVHYLMGHICVVQCHLHHCCLTHFESYQVWSSVLDLDYSCHFCSLGGRGPHVVRSHIHTYMSHALFLVWTVVCISFACIH